MGMTKRDKQQLAILGGAAFGLWASVIAAYFMDRRREERERQQSINFRIEHAHVMEMLELAEETLQRKFDARKLPFLEDEEFARILKWLFEEE